MKLGNYKLFLLAGTIFLFAASAAAQTTSTDNTLNSTGVAAIQSTTSSNYQLSIGGAVKIFHSGNSGLSSASLYLLNTSASGREYFINSDNAGSFRIVDNTAGTPRFIVYNSGNIGVGTSSDGGYKFDVNGTSRFSLDAIVNSLTVGKGSGTNTTTNTAFGLNVLGANTTGTNNTAFGYKSLYSNTEGFQNVAIGVNAMYSTTGTGSTGYQNTAMGYEALYSNTTGNNNTAIGSHAMYTNTTGVYNTGIGSSALASNTTGIYNTAVGVNAMVKTTTGGYNTAVGYTTLNENLTGTSNTAIGWQALFANTGNNNTAVGRDALTYNTTGINNTAVGMSALYQSGTGYNNTALGTIALQSTNSGIGNTASGVAALQFNTDGSYNSAFGHYAGNDVTTGQYNLLLGPNAGRGITTGNYNTIIGGQVTGLSSSLSNNIIIADGQGNRRINVDASGNVGIGTTTPSAFVHIKSQGGSNRGLLIESTSSANYATMELRNDADDLTQIGLTGSSFSSGIFNSKSTTINTNAAGGINLVAYNAAGNVRFATGGTATSNERMRIDNNGNVGIGITSPTAQLHTTGTVRFAGLTNDNSVDRIVATDANGNLYYRSASSLGGSGTGGWSLTGNALTDPATHFIGTTDDKDFVIKANNNTLGVFRSNRQSVALGIAATVTGANSTAIGYNATGSGDLATAIGYNTTASATYATAMGYLARSTGSGSVSIGSNTTASGDYSMATGTQTIARSYGEYATGIFNTDVSPLSTNSFVNNDRLFTIGNGTDDTHRSNALTILKSGNIGIGTSSPTHKIHAYGLNPSLYLEGDDNSYYTSIVLKSNVGTGIIDNYGPLNWRSGIWSLATSANNKNSGVGATTQGNYAITLDPTLTPFSVMGAQSQTGDLFRVNKNVSPTIGYVTEENVFNINKDGNVGIGTANTTGTDYKLYVETGIRTRKVKVDVASWPDYVFMPTYKPLSLTELEEYLLKNKHLPDVPSAEEVEKNGIDLGSNQTVLLKKVEELTLYMIEMSKQMEALNKKVEALSKENEQLKNNISNNK
ncbi:beta strand repeat-containing protein [Ferruginibacter sp.]